MIVENFCKYIKEVRERAVSRADIDRAFPWHLSTIRGYERDKLCDIDYLVAIAQLTDTNLIELVRKRVEVGIFYDHEKLDSMLSHLDKYDRLDNSNNELNRNVSIGENSELIVCEDEAMSPAIQLGATMVVDATSLDLNDGSIYCFKIGNRNVARRVQESINGSIILVSINNNFASITVNESEIKSLSVVGRVKRVTNTFEV